MAEYTYTLAGQDISDYVEARSLTIQSQLGQGAGVVGGTSGRVTEAWFDTSLGPAASAVGAGNAPSTTPYQDVVMADSPLVYLPLNDVVGSTTAEDVSGNNQDGTASGSPTFGQTSLIDAESGTALSVSNGGYIDVPITGLPSGSSSVALECWYMPTGTPASSKFPGILSLGDSVSNHDLSVLHADNNALWAGSWSHGGQNNSALMTVGQVYHIVARKPGDGNVYLYINNVLRVSAADTDTITAYKLLIGKLADSTNAHGSQGNTPGIAGHVAVYTDLSPARIAVHYNTGITAIVPSLVRQGELIIRDQSNTKVFAGYVVALEDTTDPDPRIKTHLRAHDYWADLDRVVVNELYDDQYDVDLIITLLNKYAPDIDQTLLPATNNTLIPRINLRQKTLQNALQKIADMAGFDIYVDFEKRVRYYSPSTAATAPFSVSDSPDNVTSFPFKVEVYDQDDNAIINRVRFYGGKRPTTTDFVQDLSVQADGTNKTFILAYYPRNAGDGAVHVKVHGVEQTLGNLGGDQTDPDNKLIADGGNAQVLIDRNAKALQFNTAPTNTGAASVTCTYRYELPIVLTITAEDSYAFFGRYFDGTISDDTVFDTTIAAQRCRILLTEQKFGLLRFVIRVRRGGLQAGQTLYVKHTLRGIDDTFRIQSIETLPLGNGNYDYRVSLGAWNWTLIDLLMGVAKAAALQDSSEDENITTIQAPTLPAFSLGMSFAVSTKHNTHGDYYWRTSPAGDGKDIYWGYFTWG
jgi:hypothetical protein